ncbi:MAG: hypothetical protein IJD10_00550 [Clostridia bacterium]|nr:hypothetical protein [Clostridia bacterium]
MNRSAEYLRRYAEGDDNALRAILDLYREGLIAVVDQYVHHTVDAEHRAEFSLSFADYPLFLDINLPSCYNVR